MNIVIKKSNSLFLVFLPELNKEDMPNNSQQYIEKVKQVILDHFYPF